jgi:hypothetical protein
MQVLLDFDCNILDIYVFCFLQSFLLVYEVIVTATITTTTATILLIKSKAVPLIAMEALGVEEV